MNSVLPLEDYETRRILLEDYLKEYEQLAKEAPAVAEKLTFNAYVQFSFAYYSISTQVGSMENLEYELGQLKNKLS